MILESGKLKSMPVESKRVELAKLLRKVKRTNSAPNFLSVDANFESIAVEQQAHSARIKNHKDSNYDFSQDDMRVSNESEEQHNHPAMPRIMQKELDA